MRNYARKYWVLRFLTVAAVVCISSLSVFAADANAPPGDANKPPVQTPFEQRLQKKISVQFRTTPIRDVIRIMAEQTDVDFVVNPAVTGDVTVTLTNVPLEEALNNILSAYGASYVLSDNMIRVVTAAEKTEKPEMLQTRTYEIVYADVKEVVKALDKFKSKQGMVTSIQGTSHIIVKDTESTIRDISTFIEKIDRMTVQILVEARIYDITSKDKLDIGVEWNAGRDTTYYTGDEAVVPTAGTIGNPTSPTGDTEPFATGIFRGATGKTSSTTGLLKFGWLKDGVNIDAIIRAQQENIDAKLLANPRILVLDNETAKIDIISEIPYQQLNQGQSSGQSFGTTEFKEVGVTLEVTPHVAVRDEMIRLKLKPTFSVQTGTVDVGDPSQGVKYPQPVVDKRTADTTLLIKNGQTVVLGGLRKKTVTKQINKVPFLGDLPLAGVLFRFTGEDTVNSEIVVFVTPWIIKQPVMSQGEQQAYDATEFKGPKTTTTRAEKAEE